MINVCFGQLSLLGFKDIEQAIIGFDLEVGTFTFVDRNDSKLQLNEIRNQIVESGLVYP